jgi:MFS family permease
VIKSRHGLLGLLTVLNLVNYIDRFIIMAVSPKIQESFGLSDAQTGLVVSVFMFGYFLSSPLFGWLGDRYPRKGLIAAGVAVWSIATVCSGLAGGFASMLLTRIVVGVGEASYATMSPTIIDDITTKEQKSRWLAVFYAAIPVGAAFGFLLGGYIEHHYDWRMAFFVAGGPGIVLALTTLLIDEPQRARAAHEAPRAGRAGYAMLARNRTYVHAVAGYIAQTFALGGFTAWAAPFLYRKLCLELRDADFYFGGVTVVTGLVGTVLGGFIADRTPGEDRARACLRVCAWSSAVAAPLALAAFFATSVLGFFVALGACQLAIFVSISPTNAALLSTVPTWLRATAMAVSIFMIHLLGDLISPPLIGAMSDRFGDSAARCSGAVGLQIGMYLLPAALALSAIAWWRGSRGARVSSLATDAA